MSRAKTTDAAEAETVAVKSESADVQTAESTVESVDTTENTESNLETTEPEQTEISKKEEAEKISVIQYLELNPQSVYIAALMKKNYEMKFNSKSDWDLLLQKLIGKKIN